MLVAGATACDEAGHVSMTVTVTTDQYPEETGWSVVTPAGDTVMENGNLVASTEVATGPLCVPTGSVFAITDSYGDGICCAYGAGSYSLDVEFGAPAYGNFDISLDHFPRSLKFDDAVYCDLLGAHAYCVLICACNPML